MICNNCNKSIPSTSEFCTFCVNKTSNINRIDYETKRFDFSYKAAVKIYLKKIILVSLLFSLFLFIGLTLGVIQAGGFGNLGEGAIIGFAFMFFIAVGFQVLIALLSIPVRSGYDKLSYITINKNGNLLEYYCVSVTANSKYISSREMYYTINNIVKIEEGKNSITIFGDIVGKHINGSSFLPESALRIEIKKIYENMDFIIDFIKSNVVSQSKNEEIENIQNRYNTNNKTNTSFLYSKKVANKTFNKVLLKNSLIIIMLFLAPVLMLIPITVIDNIIKFNLGSLMILLITLLFTPVTLGFFMYTIFLRIHSPLGWYRDNYISVDDDKIKYYVKRGITSTYYCTYIINRIKSVKETGTHIVLNGSIYKYRSDLPEDKYETCSNVKILKVFDDLDSFVEIAKSKLETN